MSTDLETRIIHSSDVTDALCISIRQNQDIVNEQQSQIGKIIQICALRVPLNLSIEIDLLSTVCALNLENKFLFMFGNISNNIMYVMITFHQSM